MDPAYLGTISHQGCACIIDGLGYGTQSCARLYRIRHGRSDYRLVTAEYVRAKFPML